MQSFYIYLDLYNGSGIIDSIVINGGGMGLGGGWNTKRNLYNESSIKWNLENSFSCC